MKSSIGPATTKTDIQELLEASGIRLAPEHIDFLLAHGNGFMLNPSPLFSVSGCADVDEVDAHYIYGVGHPTDYLDLCGYQKAHEFDGFLPKNVVVLAGLSTADGQICYDLESRTGFEVVYWAGTDSDFMDILFPVATFADFEAAVRAKADEAPPLE